MHKPGGKRKVLKYATGLLTLAAFFLSSCAAGYLNPGPNPSKIRVKLKAEVKQKPKSWHYGGPFSVTWDWGLYLVRADNTLAALGPADKQRLKVLQVNPLLRDTVFLAPPGNLKLRLILDAYYFKPHAEGYLPISLGGTIRDFQISLPQGGEKQLEVVYPEH